MPPSIWPSTDSGLSALPDVLGGRHLHHLDQAEVGVDVDDRPVGDERERGVAVALALLVELLGGPVVVLDRPVELGVAHRVGDGLAERPHRVDHVGALDHQPQRVDPLGGADPLEQVLADGPARGIDRAAAHPRLARRRRRAGRADRRVDRVQLDVLDAEHGAGDLARRS